MPKFPAEDDINLGDILFADNYIDGLVQVMQYAFSPDNFTNGTRNS
jgi:hypothetical protein